MSYYEVYRENGSLVFKTPSGGALNFNNGYVASVEENSSSQTAINIIRQDGGFVVYKEEYNKFNGSDDQALGSTRAEVILALEGILTVDVDLGRVIKPDLSAGKSETTDFVHNESIANGGAVILQTEEAKIGVQGNHIEFDSTGSYGDVNINVKTAASQSDNAIHVFGTNLFQNPQIEMKGDTEFEGSVTLTASNGNKYYLKVSNTGNLYTEAV
jgi:hypothetical protein